MAPKHIYEALPLDERWSTEDEYVQKILSFATSAEIFRNLCGGVHILDFLTREPDLYTTILPEQWREWFDLVELDDVLDFLLRPESERDASSLEDPKSPTRCKRPDAPQSLHDYVDTIRSLCLRRQFSSKDEDLLHLPRHISVGMKPKKIHEVTNFATYVESLSADVSETLNEPLSIVDFGSGQNYLGRTLASPPYNKHVFAIERRHHNIYGAKGMDVHAKLAQKEKIMRNKKEYKRALAMNNGIPTPPEDLVADRTPAAELAIVHHNHESLHADSNNGSIKYIEHDIEDGNLESILYNLEDESRETLRENCGLQNKKRPSSRPKVVVVSLHSCGNLSHHGLSSLVLNTSVSAVAMIGCCYNLLTERLGPATYKHPQLRPNHPRLEATGSACDIHGFPMSRTLENFAHEDGKGVRLNITARMMAVQAPYNWGPVDSEAFFRRHFYRALLQRILLDCGVVKQCTSPDQVAVAGGSLSGKDFSGTPLIVGALRKACFANFRDYVRGALAKLRNNPEEGPIIALKTQNLTDETIDRYEAQWGHTKKNLSIVWSLMAFSAGVIESIITVDRWLYLREQECVADCWVETVFDYKQSPRNLVVVGIKKAAA